MGLWSGLGKELGSFGCLEIDLAREFEDLGKKDFKITKDLEWIRN